MSNVKTGQVWTGLIVCKDSTGALATPSVGPVGALYVNGIVNAASVTITGSNPYKWSVTLPALTAGDTVSMYITATIATIATAAVVAEGIADTMRTSDAAPASTALTNATWTDARAGKIDYLDASVNAVKTKTDNLPASPAATGDIPNAAAIAADVQTGLTAQGYTTTRAGYLDVLNGLVAAIWANVSRTLTANPGLTMADIRTAIGMAAANLDALIAGIPAADDALLTLAHGVGSWQSGVFNLQPGDAATIATAVDAAMTASHGVGSWQRVTGVSPNIVTYVLEADGNPVASGQVWIYTDAACTNLVAYGVSDTFGQITFYLAAGTYYVKRFKDTVTLFTPTVITMVVT